ncbi:MAG: hypothetical protein ACE5EF_09130 [Dehalococcoidia bacterium]
MQIPDTALSLLLDVNVQERIDSARRLSPGAPSLLGSMLSKLMCRRGRPRTEATNVGALADPRAA